MILNVANTQRIKNFESETIRLGTESGFKLKDTWYLQLSNQEGKDSIKREPFFIFEK